MTQSMGQAKALQPTEEVKATQEPPCMEAEVMERDLVLEPVPHDLVQAPKEDQPETLQLRGQLNVLQTVDDERIGHATPPLATPTTMVRVLVFLPVPQDLVQAPYVDQAETLQSTGQAWVLQTRSSEVGQASPPCLAEMSTA
jgi:hypothetical protein